MKINLVDAFQIAAKPFFKKLLVLIRRHRITIQILNSYAYVKFFILYLSAIGLFLSNILAHDPASDMVAAAKRFLKSLDPNAKKIAQFTFKSAERENWHFFPIPLSGLMEGKDCH